MLPMKLLDWIDKSKLDLFYLSLNPNAIEILKENYDLIEWSMLSRNHNIIKFTKKKLKKYIGLICLLMKTPFQF
jgi:hypothetical protein